MKPTKNKFYCKDCGRTKMLFETEKKADNFIAFNQEKISKEAEYAPQRSYFCLFCGGWHITSIKEEIGKSKNEKLLEQLLIEKTTPIKSKLKSQIKSKNHEENRRKLFIEVESSIKEMDNNQKEAFFTEQINSLNKEVEDLSNSSDQNKKEKLKKLRQKLEVTYIVRKQNGFQKANKFKEKVREREIQEWLKWLKEKGHIE